MLALLTAIASAATLAVLPFDQGAAPAELDGFGHALSAMVMTDFTKVDGVTVVERERLDAILAELDLSKTEFVDKRTAVSLGRGLAADHVVTGSFTVIDGTLAIDARIVHVETGKLVKADRASGPVTDFVTVEKDVVDRLVTNLDLSLSGKSRREVMGTASTESLDAFSAYGKGLLAGRSGDEEGARQAYSAALTADPNFAEAKAALARLSTRVEAAAGAREAARLDARLLAQERVLAETTDERERKRGFRHDEQSLAAWLLRLETLLRTEQHCVRYEEMRAHLEREGLPNQRHDNFELARAIALLGVELGRWTPEQPDWRDDFEPKPAGTPFLIDRGFDNQPLYLRSIGNGPDDFLWDIYSWAGDPGGMDRGDGILSSLHMCYEGEEEVAELRGLIGLLSGDPQLQQPLTQDFTALDIERALDAHLASTVAWKQGLLPEAEATAEALLALAATVPSTDEEFFVQGLARHIQQYGERWVREQESAVAEAKAEALSEKKRLGYSEQALDGILKAFVDQDTALLALDRPMCQAALQAKQGMAQHRVDQLADARVDGTETKWIYDELWTITASPRAVGCFAGEEGEFDSVAEIYAFVDAVELPAEPSRDCRTWVRSFRDNYQNSASRMDPEQFPVPAAMVALTTLDEYYRLEFLGCL